MSTHKVLRQIDPTDLNLGPTALDVRKKNFETLVSYNWLDKDTPTILVPGSPALWASKPPGTKVPQDSGLVVIDQNAYHNPKYPLEPLFRALLTEKPDFDLSDIDLVANRGALLKLLGSISGKNDREYTINVQRFGNTTLFTRTEGDSTSHIDLSHRGYGHSFERAYTEWPTGMENSACHYRIARYEFGGVCCMIRFEADAFMYETNDPDVDGDLSDLLSGISIKNAPDVCDSSTLKVVKLGTLVPHSSIIEIKTKSVGARVYMDRVLSQAWFSATPSLVVGFHCKGRFDEVRNTRIENDLDIWERRNTARLAKLAALLQIIIEEAKKAQGGRCVVHGGLRGLLTIKRSNSKNDVLPEDLKVKFG